MGIPNTTKTTIGINWSIKFPFCGRNDLVERSLRPGARSWQAGMTRLGWPRRNGRRRADSDSFSRHNDSRPGRSELIDIKCGGFMKINATKSAGSRSVLGGSPRINQAEMSC
jgi:hypothetical protein